MRTWIPRTIPKTNLYVIPSQVHRVLQTSVLSSGQSLSLANMTDVRHQPDKIPASIPAITDGQGYTYQGVHAFDQHPLVADPTKASDIALVAPPKSILRPGSPGTAVISGDTDDGVASIDILSLRVQCRYWGILAGIFGSSKTFKNSKLAVPVPCRMTMTCKPRDAKKEAKTVTYDYKPPAKGADPAVAKTEPAWTLDDVVDMDSCSLTAKYLGLSPVPQVALLIDGVEASLRACG